jgi:hypothetical protein
MDLGQTIGVIVCSFFMQGKGRVCDWRAVLIIVHKNAKKGEQGFLFSLILIW